MGNLFDACDPEIKRKADELIKDIKSHKEIRRILPNSSAEFSDENALRNLDLLTKADDYDEMIRKAYDC